VKKCTSPAMKRYTARLFVLMAAYLLALFVAVTTFKGGMVRGILSWILAILPALPIIGIFWAVMRLMIEETDEFIKVMLMRQNLVATGFCLTVMTIWEFLLKFHLVPANNFVIGTAMVWFIGLGFGALYNRLTLGATGN
jgi:hypothetical protein